MTKKPDPRKGLSTSAAQNGKATLASLAEAKGLPVEFLRDELGLHDLPGGGVGIPYYRLEGDLITVKRRTTLAARDGSWWPKGQPLEAYGLWRLAENQTGFLILVEGESDCWALWHHGLPALGIPGSNAQAVVKPSHLNGVETLYLVREPGQSGDAFVPGMVRRLAAIEWAGKAFELCMPDGLKDPADLHCAGSDEFLGRMQAAIQASTPLALVRPAPAGPHQVGEQRHNRQRKPLYAEASRKRVLSLPPFQPFPTAFLPSPLRDFVEQGAAALGCDTSFLALPALAVAASAIGNARVIELKAGGWAEPAIVWAAVVSQSGTLKTPAWVMALQPLFRRQHRENRQHRKDHEAWAAELAGWEKKRRQKGGNPGSRPEKPIRRRQVVSDITIEKLAEILEDNPRGVLCARDELSGWLYSLTRYKGRASISDLPNWLEAFRGGPWMVDRKTGDRTSLFVPRATVSICGNLVPGLLQQFLGPEHLDAGLAPRFLLTMPPDLGKRWSDLEVCPATEAAYATMLDNLLALEMDCDEDGDLAPFRLKMSPEAKTAWVHFYNHFAQEQAAVEGEFRAALAKLEAYAARFALLHHVISSVAAGMNDRESPIDVSSVQAGVGLCWWFVHEARRVYATLRESGAEREARRLVEFIRARGGTITARQLQNANTRKYPSAEAATEALDTLLQDGLGEWVERNHPERGGHSTRIFALRPYSDKRGTVEEIVEDVALRLHPHPTSDTSYTRPPAGPGGPAACPAGPSDTCSPTIENPCVSGASVGSVGRRTHEVAQRTPAPPEQVSDGPDDEEETGSRPS
jgi:hypothetical protein